MGLSVYVLYNSQQYQLDVEDNDLVSALKEKILVKAIDGVTNVSLIKLTFNGVELLNSTTVSDNSIGKGAELTMTYADLGNSDSDNESQDSAAPKKLFTTFIVALAILFLSFIFILFWILWKRKKKKETSRL